jgi:hypothetical protein
MLRPRAGAAAGVAWRALQPRARAGRARGEQALAERAYREALALNPEYAEAHNNLGLALELQGRLDDALAHFDRALELAPEFASAHANRAQLRLLQGDFGRGWPEYEWRWRLPGVALPRVDAPVWDGSALAGRTICLRAEQGFGDTLQFVRFASILQGAGATTVVECQPALARLLAKQRGVHAAVPRGVRLPRCDFQIPLASLPGALGVRDEGAIPAVVPYLAADAALRDKWRAALATSDGFKVGIAWRGNPRHPQDCHRSIPPERFGALGAVPGVRFVSLQAGERATKALSVIEPAADPERSPLPFEELASLIATLSRRHVRHRHRPSRGRARASGLDRAPARPRLALAARTRGLAVVSDGAALPTGAARRLGGGVRAGCGRAGGARGQAGRARLLRPRVDPPTPPAQRQRGPCAVSATSLPARSSTRGSCGSRRRGPAP